VFGVERPCRLLGLPRSSFYAWVNRVPTARERADAELLEVIVEIHDASRGTYRVPRVYGQLRRRGHRVARSRVARLMRHNGLQGAHVRRKWKRSRPDGDPTEDLVERDFCSLPSPVGNPVRSATHLRLGASAVTPRTRRWSCRR
jgi:putative transposase